MATLTLRIPDELDQELERQSAATRLSKSDLAREALQRYLRIVRYRTLRSRLVPLAQAQGLNTDEDVFRALDQP
jgi:predicted transcriptional regulator